MAECDRNATRRVPLEFDDDGTPDVQLCVQS